MYFVGFCHVCGQGLLGIRVCCEPDALIVCDECEAVWTSPECGEPPLYPDPEGSLCPRCHKPLWDLPAHWASREEIAALAWSDAVMGEVGEPESDSGG